MINWIEGAGAMFDTTYGALLGGSGVAPNPPPRLDWSRSADPWDLVKGAPTFLSEPYPIPPFEAVAK